MTLSETTLKCLRKEFIAWRIDHRGQQVTNEEFGLMTARWPFSTWRPLLQRRTENDRRSESIMYVVHCEAPVSGEFILNGEDETMIRYWIEGFLTALRSTPIENRYLP